MSDIQDFTRDHMDKCVTSLKANFAKVRTGRANPHVLDSIRVDYYGVATPITQLAAVKVPEATMLVVEPWDKTALNAIEKAIATSDLGITPGNDGSAIRLPFPSPTEERRRELAKECRAYGEDARVAVRNVRREANTKLEHDDDLSDDDVTRGKQQVQKVTDSFIEKIDELVKAKEAEVMEI
ncbi:MAG: ribosome recycling factor [Atopobiaceae bacterium]|jgi:ribosome recycling factor|nr:ribosome recycling factor [Atopobiaceae bacterium]MCH4180036.1 ribosome recycling factor [Atopobiaceae bacterium]MCH4213912.1 ribosome recycling factor [Atopobiaceae bacterium]MCH4229838.1 ribosome recycling factor [Atopobiaceae bacterium]MCH4275625.1 ribosome recycling factor [Atopobiaceae bacterium]